MNYELWIMNYPDLFCFEWCHQQKTCLRQRTMRERRWQDRGRLTHHHWQNLHVQLWRQRSWWKSLVVVLIVWGNRRQMPNHTLTRRSYSTQQQCHRSDRRVQESVQPSLRNVVVCRVHGSQMSIRIQGVKPIIGGMFLYFQLLETIILNFSSLTIFCIYIFLPLMLLHSTFNIICGFVWHVARGIVTLTACKDRASFLFCPKIHHKVCRERQKYYVCGIC